MCTTGRANISPRADGALELEKAGFFPCAASRCTASEGFDVGDANDVVTFWSLAPVFVDIYRGGDIPQALDYSEGVRSTSCPLGMYIMSREMVLSWSIWSPPPILVSDAPVAPPSSSIHSYTDISGTPLMVISPLCSSCVKPLPDLSAGCQDLSPTLVFFLRSLVAQVCRHRWPVSCPPRCLPHRGTALSCGLHPQTCQCWDPMPGRGHLSVRKSGLEMPSPWRNSQGRLSRPPRAVICRASVLSCKWMFRCSAN